MVHVWSGDNFWVMVLLFQHPGPGGGGQVRSSGLAESAGTCGAISLAWQAFFLPSLWVCEDCERSCVG